MSTSLARAAAPAPLSRLESLRLSPAKANLSNQENKPRVGAALLRAINICGFSLKEVAALLDVDVAQLGRWVRGDENVQLHRIYATKLHGPFAIEMARDAAGCTVETTVTYKAVAP